ncbi:PPC domain-containing DNA-binding protein [Rhizobium rhizogenes]|uniref:DNA-binding protein n=1 Tax=Rhizobium rhizogenes TaxID=359 RepID=A0AA92H9F7_RHIRH|nr:PPC domain-containing DNA-binding protein [Rhizobium rhizogenes]PVE54868.1 DNA-binding protein [Rhizobium rhizogenes]PVE67423.1 DNA-binding protein [Agrobacterium tumefaciens]PVE77200.1 DNA-binding protein [Sphingomonas sp. TPD3009]
MQSKELGKSDPWSERNFVLVLDDGEEAFGAITKFCGEQNITGASLTAIGAFKRAKLGFFDFTQKRYIDIPVDTQSEVLSAIGDVAVDDEGKASVHMHAVLGFADGSTKGGHFISGIVHPTLEIIIRESAVALRRRKRPDLGIALLDV